MAGCNCFQNQAVNDVIIPTIDAYNQSTGQTARLLDSRQPTGAGFVAYAGTKVTINIVLQNDTNTPKQLRVSLLGRDGAPFYSQQSSLEPYGRGISSITWVMIPDDVWFSVALYEDVYQIASTPMMRVAAGR